MLVKIPHCKLLRLIRSNEIVKVDGSTKSISKYERLYPAKCIEWGRELVWCYDSCELVQKSRKLEISWSSP